MGYVKTFETEVDASGGVRLDLPDLAPGQRVVLSVVADDQPAPEKAKRPLGLLRGKIHYLPGWDEPIEF